MNLAENLLVGVLSGVISGIIVAIFLWAWETLRRDSLELVFVAPERAFLRNNRCRTAVVGGSWELEKGPVIFRGDDFRGEEYGLVVNPFKTLAVRTRLLQPGQPTFVTVKRLPLRLGKLPEEKLRQWEESDFDPCVFIGRENQLPKGWTIQTIFLRA